MTSIGKYKFCAHYFDSNSSQNVMLLANIEKRLVWNLMYFLKTYGAKFTLISTGHVNKIFDENWGLNQKHMAP